MSAVNIEGHCDPAFGRVKQAFQENFAKGKERGAGVSIVIEGRQVVNIRAGRAIQIFGNAGPGQAIPLPTYIPKQKV